MRDNDTVFAMALNRGTTYGAEPLPLPSFKITPGESGVFYCEEKPSDTEVDFKEACIRLGVKDYRLLRACILHDLPAPVWYKEDLWKEALPHIESYVNSHDWARNHVLDFSEDDVICTAESKTYCVRDIQYDNMDDSILLAMAQFTKRFWNLPEHFRIVDDDHIQHAWWMKHWYLDYSWEVIY